MFMYISFISRVTGYNLNQVETKRAYRYCAKLCQFLCSNILLISIHTGNAVYRMPARNMISEDPSITRKLILMYDRPLFKIL